MAREASLSHPGDSSEISIATIGVALSLSPLWHGIVSWSGRLAGFSRVPAAR